MQLNRKIRITFVWPEGFLPSYAIPLAFGFLKANVDPELYDFQIIDCVLDKLNARHPVFRERLRANAPNIVGVSSWSPMFPEALEILKVAGKSIPA